MIKKNFLVFFGPPGSGKGTQVEKVSQKFKLPIISTGNLLRHEQEEGTPFGKKLSSILNRGELVPDIIINKIVAENLEKISNIKGAIFDGFPRNEKQQKFLLRTLKKVYKDNFNIYAVLINLSEKIILERLTGRRVCECGETYHLLYNPPRNKNICLKCDKKLFIREDDKPVIVKNRIKIYQREIVPILKFWENKSSLIIINGKKKISEINRNIFRELKKINF